MKILRINFLKDYLFIFFISILLFLFGLNHLSAQEISWTEVANINNEIQSIDTSSIKYNRNGLLSVIAKYKKINPDDQSVIYSDSFLMVIDCENRLFNKLPVNADFTQDKNLIKPLDNKLMKRSILKSCSY